MSEKKEKSVSTVTGEETGEDTEFKSIYEEIEYLRAENAYLKKLRALIRKPETLLH